MYVPSVIILLDRVFRPYASDEGCVLGKLCSTPPHTHRNKMGAYELNLFTFHGEEGSGEGVVKKNDFKCSSKKKTN